MSGISEQFAHPSTGLRSAYPGWTGYYDQVFPGAWDIAQPRRDGGSDPDQALVSRITLVLASVYPSAKLANVKDPLCSLLK